MGRAVLKAAINFYFSYVERVRQHIFDGLMVYGTCNLWDRCNVYVVCNLFFRPFPPTWLLREPLLPRPLTQLPYAPIAGSVQLEDALDGRSTLRVEWLVIRTFVKVTDRRTVDAAPFAAKFLLCVAYLLADDLRVVR